MHRNLRNMLNLAGIDRAIGYSVFGRIIGLAAQPVTVFLLATYLTGTERGYYFAFQSLLGLIVFLDLGITSVLQIFASHEKAYLEWGDSGVLKGDFAVLARLRGLLRLGLIWFGAAGLFVVLIIYPVGIWFFSRESSVSFALWHMPWLFACFVTAFSVITSPLFNVLEGCGRVKELRLLGILQPLASYPVFWLALLLGGGIFAGPLRFLIALLVSLSWLWSTHSGFLNQNVTLRKQETTLHWREMWPLQWRTALGWMSGYIVVQVFTIITFAYSGAVEAGIVGMSMMLSQQVGGVAMNWITTKTPRFGMHWARKEFAMLDSLFIGSLWRMLAVCAAGCVALVLIILFLEQYAQKYANVVLGSGIFIKLMIVQMLNNIIQAESLYLRANKRDPLVWPAVGNGGLLLVSSWMLIKRHGVEGMINGYLVVTIIFLIACTIIFLRCRNQWQNGVVLK